MNLPKPQPKYDDGFFARVFSQLAAADNRNLKRDQDIEVGQNRVILTSPNGTRYAVVVSNAGALSASAV